MYDFPITLKSSPYTTPFGFTYQTSETYFFVWVLKTLKNLKMSNPSTRVYVGGLSHRTREKDVERFFRKFGRIREISMKVTRDRVNSFYLFIDRHVDLLYLYIYNPFKELLLNLLFSYRMDFVSSNLMTTEMPMMPVTNAMDEIFLERGKKPAIFLIT